MQYFSQPYFSQLLFSQPWRCLCLRSVHITLTTPLRRTILQLRQIFLTDALTFILVLQQPIPIIFYYRISSSWLSLIRNHIDESSNEPVSVT